MTNHVQQINDSQVAHQPLVYRENLTASGWSHCDRAMWLSLRNCSDQKHKAETLRTFAIGHALEDEIIKWLQHAGYKISHQQAEIKNRHGKPLGHIDGIIFADNKYRLLEIKTSADKYFKDWIKNGAPEKYNAQAQLYCHHSDQLSQAGRKLTEIMWVVINKNTSEIYIDIQPYDEQYAELQTDRIHGVIESEQLPAGEDDYRCNMCYQKSVCRGEVVSQINCRTCAHVSVVNGSFDCVHGYGKICHRYNMHPQLVELLGYKFIGIDNENEAVIYDKFAMASQCVTVKDKPTFSSDEFVVAHNAGLVNNNFILGMKEMLDATVESAQKLL